MVASHPLLPGRCQGRFLGAWKHLLVFSDNLKKVLELLFPFVSNPLKSWTRATPRSAWSLTTFSAPTIAFIFLKSSRSPQDCLQETCRKTKSSEEEQGVHGGEVVQSFISDFLQIDNYSLGWIFKPFFFSHILYHPFLHIKRNGGIKMRESDQFLREVPNMRCQFLAGGLRHLAVILFKCSKLLQ